MSSALSRRPAWTDPTAVDVDQALRDLTDTPGDVVVSHPPPVHSWWIACSCGAPCCIGRRPIPESAARPQETPS